MDERAHFSEAPEPTDPEDVLTGADHRDDDHVPADGDDREVVLDEPDGPAPPPDDDIPA